MKKIRIPIYIVLGLFLTTFILGSFFDYQINSALFSRDNPFGLTIAAIGTIPGYGVFAIVGGGLFAFFLKKEYPIVARVFLMIGAVGCACLGILFSGREIFGVNGFYHKGWNTYGYLIVSPIMFGFAFLGFSFTRKSDNPYLWIVYIVIMIAVFVALVPGVTMIKSIFHRPRYRFLDLTGENFYPWWKPCKNYNELLASYESIGVTKDEFKSFPSGHTGGAAVSMVFAMILPLINRKYMKYQLPIFFGCLAWTLLVAFTRMLVGAHFLSDISMGGLLTMICAMIANEVVIHHKLTKQYQLEETVIE